MKKSTHEPFSEILSPDAILHIAVNHFPEKLCEFPLSLEMIYIWKQKKTIKIELNIKTKKLNKIRQRVNLGSKILSKWSIVSRFFLQANH